jgi:hypothetical protein
MIDYVWPSTKESLVIRRIVFALLVCSLVAGQASAQNWSFDARKIALGSAGGDANLATQMIEEARNYRAIVLPFGLFQVLHDINKLDPTNDEFDLIRTMEYAASPIHYTFGRDTMDSGSRFVEDIRSATLHRDLNYYRGFVPANQPRAEGLAAPNWGRTIKIATGPGGAFQGVYVGAGPYFSMRSDVAIDPQLITILSSSSDVYLPNAEMHLGSANQGQMAVAITGGYRGRFALPNAVSDRDGIYVALNYNYLHGFQYDDVNLALRLDTDRTGLLTINPLLPIPLLVTRNKASPGTGLAVDFGIGTVVDRWDFGVGVNGIGNRINWKDVEQTTYSMRNPFLGDSTFVESVPLPLGEVRVVLPVNYRGTAGYNADAWSAVAEAGRGFGGNSFHGGYEYRFTRIDLRGGAGYTREMWNPAGGVGFNISERLALDVALYGNSANVERKRNPALAVSLRLNR